MMSLRNVLSVLAILLTLLAAWLWFNRYSPVDMAAYVPADTPIYLEINSLPDVLEGVVDTNAWKALDPLMSSHVSARQVRWLGRLAAWSGVGPAEVVVLSRAQVAVAVFGLGADVAGDALRIRPSIALVAETHTGERRTRAVVLSRVEEYARRIYGVGANVERRQIDGTEFNIWTSASGDRRIVAAVVGSVAVVGSDETAVRNCLAVRRGERQSLAGSAGLADMRSRLAGGGTTETGAFGYASAEGTTKLLEIAAVAYAGQITTEPRMQGLVATVLPPLARRTLGAIGWKSRFIGGGTEDQYFVAVQNGVAARLRDSLAAPPVDTIGDDAALLPLQTWSFSRYLCSNPAAAWHTFNIALSAQLLAVDAALVGAGLNQLLKPYGIDEPERFLSTIGGEIVTARLDPDSEHAVVIFQVRNEQALREFVAKRIGAAPRHEKFGDYDLIVSRNEEHGAACFMQNRLLMGDVEDLRRVLAAQVAGHTLKDTDRFERAKAATSTGANATTFTEDSTSQGILEMAAPDAAAKVGPEASRYERVLNQLPMAVTESQITADGVERRTRSAFGQFGAIASQLASGAGR